LERNGNASKCCRWRNSPLDYVPGDPKCRDNSPLDLLAGLASSFAGSPILSAGLIEVRDKSVALDGCRLKQGQEPSGLLYSINRGVQDRDVSRYSHEKMHPRTLAEINGLFLTYILIIRIIPLQPVDYQNESG
jgi:hypothetical protein